MSSKDSPEIGNDRKLSVSNIHLSGEFRNFDENRASQMLQKIGLTIQAGLLSFEEPITPGDYIITLTVPESASTPPEDNTTDHQTGDQQAS